MSIKETILSEIQEVVSSVREKQVESVLQYILKEKRVFILGEGRSGLQGKSFAMRLMHLSYTVYVIGETITPSIQKEDVLIAISGSGTTSSILSLAKKAKDNGIEVIGITSDSESELAKRSSEVLIVPGATKKGTGINSIQLLSTLFDQSVHIVLDYICLLISQRDKVSNEEASAQHSNME